MQQELTVKPVTFRQFVFREHKDMLIIAGLGMVTLFVVYKIVYPFPDLYYDSYHYLHMAEDSSYITVWPIGYPLFLRLLHWITPSPYVLVAIQYMLLQASSFWLLFTFFFIMRPLHCVKVILIAFLVVNPLYYYLANLVSSDILFTILSLAWLTVLLHMMIRVSYWQLLLQGPLLAYLFLVRYQAIYYPLVMLAALLMAETSRFWKILSAVMAFVLLGWIILATKQFNQKRYGNSAFSPQSGWMLANNALYMYPHMTLDTMSFGEDRLRNMDWFVRDFIQKRRAILQGWTPADGPQMMLQYGPMWAYMVAIIQANPGQSVHWYYNRLGDDWGRYGKLLIRACPIGYVRYFILPNIGAYLFPIQEQFEQYASGRVNMTSFAAKWFDLPNRHIEALWPKGAQYMTEVFRPLFFLINIGFLWAGFVTVRRKRYIKMDMVIRKCLSIAIMSFVGNACLLVLAGPVVMRYQVYAITLGMILLLLMVSYSRCTKI